uniref:Uncharacterized protein n=1 Tax=viral metagenome TaxID=1070528 RepID=A0A6C0CAV5_9ZZZZ
MISKKILNVLALLSIIAIIIYFYYNGNDDKKEEPKIEDKQINRRKRRRVISKKNKKKVRFNDNVKYHYYDTSDPIGDKIDIDLILSQKKVVPVLKEAKIDIIEEEPLNIVKPINLEEENADDTWDTSFGQPLITKKESRCHFDKMQKSNRKYEKSMSEFTEYQVDRSSIVEPEFKIDPFKPSTKSGNLKNQKIKDIYDMQVAAPKAAPKRIKKVTSDLITYENDSENNGGLIQGTNLHGFDSHSSIFGDAAFGNEF